MKIEHLRNLKNFNFVGINTETTGDVTYFGKTYYFGKHQGNITQADSNEITIHEEGELIGDLKAANANIFGKVTGNIHISGTLNIFGSGPSKVP